MSARLNDIEGDMNYLFFTVLLNEIHFEPLRQKMKNNLFMNFVFDQQITSFYLAIGVNLRIYEENGKF